MRLQSDQILGDTIVSYRRELASGAIAGLLLVALWWSYQVVPRADLIVTMAIGAGLLALLFQYPIVGTSIVVFVTSSNAMAVLPSGLLMPLMALTCAFAVARKMMNHDPVVPVAPVLIGFVLYATVHVVSVLWAPVYDHYEMMSLLRLLFIILVVTLTVESPGHIVLLIAVAGAGLIFSTSVTIYHTLTFFSTGTLVDVASQHGIEKSRFFGLWEDPNIAGVSAVPVLALNFAVMRCKLPTVLRMFSALSVLMGVVAVVLSQTRSAGIFMVAVIVMFLFADKRRWILLALTVGCALTVMVIAQVDFVGRIASLGRGSRDASISQRAEMVNGALSMYDDNIVLGVGSGNNLTFSPDYNFSLLGGLVSHNGYLDTLSELGVVGLLTLMVALLSVLPALRVRQWQVDPQSFEQTVGVAMRVAFLTVFAAIAIGSWSRYPLFWMVLAMISTREWAFASPRDCGPGSRRV